MIAVVVALALMVAGPPPATFEAGAAHARLAVSGWCWGQHCGAPIAAATKTTAVARGSLVHVLLTFTPKHALVSVGGRPMTVVITGDEVSWHATRGGGLTVRVSASPGFVVYVGRIRLR